MQEFDKLMYNSIHCLILFTALINTNSLFGYLTFVHFIFTFDTFVHWNSETVQFGCIATSALLLSICITHYTVPGSKLWWQKIQQG